MSPKPQISLQSPCFLSVLFSATSPGGRCAPPPRSPHKLLSRPSASLVPGLQPTRLNTFWTSPQGPRIPDCAVSAPPRAAANGRAVPPVAPGKPLPSPSTRHRGPSIHSVASAPQASGLRPLRPRAPAESRPPGRRRHRRSTRVIRLPCVPRVPVPVTPVETPRGTRSRTSPAGTLSPSPSPQARVPTAPGLLGPARPRGLPLLRAEPRAGVRAPISPLPAPRGLSTRPLALCGHAPGPQTLSAP